jgi:hypothetical protein
MWAHGFDLSFDVGAFKNEVCWLTGSLPGGVALCGQSGPTRGSGPLDLRADRHRRCWRMASTCPPTWARLRTRFVGSPAHSLVGQPCVASLVRLAGRDHLIYALFATDDVGAWLRRVLRHGRVQERGLLAHRLTPWWGSFVWPVWSDSRVGTT